MNRILSELDLEKFTEDTKKLNQKLKMGREAFWAENKKNFEKNIKHLLTISSLPSKWKLWVVASHLISDHEIMPYDSGSWSTSLIIVASPKQGNDMLVFYNEARIGFLSVPAMIPLFVHELAHVVQASDSVPRYFQASVDDEIGKQVETEAEEFVQALPRELIKQAVSETILYSYDNKGWDGAQKAIDFFYIERPKLYSGGYLPWVTEKEYENFQKAKEKNSIMQVLEDF